MKVLIDTCVIVDVLQKREPFYQASMDVVMAVSNCQCLGILTAKSVTDVYYILRRSIHIEQDVRNILRILFTLFVVEDTFSTDCQLAISSPMKDYEDAIMVQTALRAGADCIVTRNLKDYALAEISVFSPEQFLEKIAEEHTNEEFNRSE